MKIIKRLGIAAVFLLVLVAAALLILHFYGISRLSSAPDIEVRIPVSSATVTDPAHGRTLVAATGCVACHAMDLGGKVMIDEAPIGYVPVPNLTTGEGGIGGQYTDKDWARAIRHGIAPDGRTLVIMPSRHYAGLTDADLADMIAYLKTVPAVDRNFDPRAIRFPGSIIFGVLAWNAWGAPNIDHTQVGSQSIEASISADYGEYLVSVGACSECHGEALAGAAFNESLQAPNLTPAGRLASWSLDDFDRALRGGVTPERRVLDTKMPWQSYSQMTDLQVGALWAYLRTTPPVATKPRD